ncbi:signal peptidase I [Streptomyces ruber]|uniref:Signal peptidase I n=2 Tax=Streptomyces TaxID=1883 RepID=A0A918BJP0_9ACTN|nr:signal peptidase I [Streptomyces ruber]GGQ71177.1 signal peptidase I [Streptomyces ruber]
MGNRGKPRGAASTPADNLLPTGSRRAGGAARPSRVERRKLARKIKRRRRRSALKEIPLLVGVAVLIALVLKTFLVQAFVIPSGSMENTIQIGDRVLVDKLTPWFGAKPQRGDVVVFKDPGGWLEDDQTTVQQDDPVGIKQVKEGLQWIGLLPSDDERDLIKRVVAIGGDTVKCCDAQGRVTVNGTSLDESYVHPGNEPSSIKFEVTVPPGRYWVMGDHRANSADSRYHRTEDYSGTVSEDSLVGRAVVIAWPIGHWSGLEQQDTYVSVPNGPVPASAASHKVAPADPNELIPLPTPAELPLVMGVVGLHRMRRGRRYGVRSGCGGRGGRLTVRTGWPRGAAGAVRRNRFPGRAERRDLGERRRPRRPGRFPRPRE